MHGLHDGASGAWPGWTCSSGRLHHRFHQHQDKLYTLRSTCSWDNTPDVILLEKTAKTPEGQQWTVPCPIGLAPEYFAIRVFPEWIQFFLTLYGTIHGVLLHWLSLVILLGHGREAQAIKLIRSTSLYVLSFPYTVAISKLSSNLSSTISSSHHFTLSVNSLYKPIPEAYAIR